MQLNTYAFSIIFPICTIAYVSISNGVKFANFNTKHRFNIRFKDDKPFFQMLE